MGTQQLLQPARKFLGAVGWRTCIMAAAIPLLASCNDDNFCCFSFTPVELSKGLVAGNFTHSGHTSLVTTSTVIYHSGLNAGNLKTYLSAGSGSFAAPTLTADGNDPLFLAAADFNGDGFLDVASGSYLDGNIYVFLNNAQSPGSFAAPLTLVSPGVSQLAVADLNGDGLPDIVSADFNVSLFVQTAPGVFAAPVSLYSGGANWVAVGDLNHDGSADVALADSVGVKVLMHTGAATSTTFAAPVAVFTQTPNLNVPGANIVAIADVNGDGYEDLIITDPGPTGGMAPTVSVLLQDTTHPGTFLAPVAYATPVQNLALSMVVTDVNGDGYPDIVIGGSSQVTVLLNDKSSPGTFLAASAYDAPNTTEIAVADVNGDGLLDIVVNLGPSQSTVNGVITNAPGVLLQSSTTAGTFGTLQALP